MTCTTPTCTMYMRHIYVYGSPDIDRYTHMVGTVLDHPTTGTPPANRKSITGGCNNRHYNGQTLFILSFHVPQCMQHFHFNIRGPFRDLLTDGQRVYPRLGKWVSSFKGKWIGTPEYVLHTNGQVGCGCGSGGLLNPKGLFFFMYRREQVGREPV